MPRERTGQLGLWSQYGSHLDVLHAIVRRAATLSFAPRVPVHAESVVLALLVAQESDQRGRLRRGLGNGGGTSRSTSRSSSGSGSSSRSTSGSSILVPFVAIVVDVVENVDIAYSVAVWPHSFCL